VIKSDYYIDHLFFSLFWKHYLTITLPNFVKNSPDRLFLVLGVST